jgi:aspartyl-tRNA(Asn)/glutamyl-tRNA(Gln) amidotransferase subunit C
MPPETRTGELILGEAEVRHVAKLARLLLEPEEVRRMTAELSAIVGYVQKLAELDTRDVAPTAQVQVEKLALREDEPRQGLPPAEGLSEAPRVAEGGFAVPAFVED